MSAASWKATNVGHADGQQPSPAASSSTSLRPLSPSEVSSATASSTGGAGSSDDVLPSPLPRGRVPSLMQLCAVSIASAPGVLLHDPGRSQLGHLGEGQTLLVLGLIMRSLKLTPPLARVFEMAARGAGHTVVLDVLRNLDVAAALIISGSGPCKPGGRSP
jgi:hypothetical protein